MSTFLSRSTSRRETAREHRTKPQKGTMGQPCYNRHQIRQNLSGIAGILRGVDPLIKRDAAAVYHFLVQGLGREPSRQGNVAIITRPPNSLRPAPMGINPGRFQFQMQLNGARGW